MFWLPKSNLPSLFYDSPDVQNKVEFNVLPVCCSTYHYAVKVTYNTIEPLTVQNLKLCTDERTHDFTLALMDFAEWDIKKAWDSGRDGTSPSTSDEDEEFYLWPDFILDLINSPREWASWRKRVERNTGGSRIMRKNSYLAALCDGFRQELEKVQIGGISPDLNLDDNTDDVEGAAEGGANLAGVKRSRSSEAAEAD
jgi:hypothetical protein